MVLLTVNVYQCLNSMAYVLRNMPDLSLAVPDATGVSLVILYLGLSVGWHVGKAMSGYDRRRQEGEPRAKLVKRFFWKATHHYDLGLIIATAGFWLLTPTPSVSIAAGWALLGFGLGMSYDDRQDHPPEGIVTNVLKQVRSQFTSVDTRQRDSTADD